MRLDVLVVALFSLVFSAYGGSFGNFCLNSNLSGSDKHTVMVIMDVLGATTCQEAELILLKNERLNLSSKGIESVKVLESFTHFKELDLNNNFIADLSPLRGLRQLQLLDLSRNDVEDIGPLEELTALKDLRLFSNFIEDISPLAMLVNLRHLRLHANYIADILPLANMEKLASLSLHLNEIGDLSPLAKLEYLEDFFSPLPNPIQADQDHCPVKDAFEGLVTFCESYLNH